eukprot:scaffold1267_cov171-Amphora_coffeaeformis.AAC.4
MTTACLCWVSSRATAFSVRRRLVQRVSSSLLPHHNTPSSWIRSRLSPARALSSSSAASIISLDEVVEENQDLAEMLSQQQQQEAPDTGFQIKAPFLPTGDQPEAIAQLVHHFMSSSAKTTNNNNDQQSACAILRGITGTGKTLVMSHVIAALQRPTLVLCHNKTLAAQLAQELRSFLGQAELFISFYNHYRPESYKEATGTYVAKKSSINTDIDALRHRATRALLTQRHVVVVASVSCLYGLGMPSEYIDASLTLHTDDDVTVVSPHGWETTLQHMLYTQVSTVDEDDFAPGTFQYTAIPSGDHKIKNRNNDSITTSMMEQIILWAPQERFPWRITTKNGKVVRLEMGDSGGFSAVEQLYIFPAKHHVMPPERQEDACLAIENELQERVRELNAEGKKVEAQRLQQRVLNDLMMIREVGFCSGIENYSRHMAGRPAGTPPETLLDYMGFHCQNDKDWFLIVDESHVTLPQLKAMYGGDQARKRMLVKHGYRLPSALDNRPLKASEFWDRVGQTLFVSATPGAEEVERVTNDQAPLVDMIIRPTFVCDPIIEVRSPEGQLKDLKTEVEERAKKGERSLVITLSKRDAEDLSSYLNDQGIPTTYIHSGLKTNARSDALRSLQTGEVDCLVGVNCLREGLDLPQDQNKIDTDHIPSSPGVYFWKDELGQILYIGKAVKLRSRVKSYMTAGANHGKRIRRMINKARSVDFVLAPTERDALVLESNLIKHHQPPFNVLLKDDEHYPYICASLGDALPRFSIVPRPPAVGSNPRHRYFGPYTSFREINIIQDRIEEKYDLRARSFLVRHGSESSEAYRASFEQALGEVSGNQSTRSDDDIRRARSEYEEAGMLFDSPRNVCRDVVTIVKSNEMGALGALVHVVQLRQGLVAGQFSYECIVPLGLENDEDSAAAIQTVLERKHYPSGREASSDGFSWFPDSILLSHAIDTNQLRAAVRQARNQVEQKRRSKIEIQTAVTRGPNRDADKRALDFCASNAMQAFVQKGRENEPGSAVSSLDGRAAKELASLLRLDKPVKRIECYDISHTQGESSVGSRVVFIDGKPAPHLYRKFNIQTVDGVDDYASIQEVLERRFLRSWINGCGGQVDAQDPWSIPDLVVIDGGQGQLNAAIQGMSKAMIYPTTSEPDPSVPRSAVVPICSLAKNKEEVFVPGIPSPVNESPDTPALLLLRSLRDESHRFALRAHRERRSVTKQTKPKKSAQENM